MHKKPWEACNVWKTEAAFWTYIRGVLRKGWSKFPLKLEFIKKNRKRINNPVEKNRERFPTCWGMTCNICKVDMVQNMIEIDHIGEGSSFTGLHDVESYVAHLFLVDYDSLRPVCKPCHKIENQRQRKGITFEQAAIEKEAISICKENVKDIIAFCENYGYNSDKLTNAKNRRKIVEEILGSV
jgi:hypothetical protein